jgi:hypothetical protein
MPCPAGQDVVTYNYEAGLLYSVPIYRSGLQVRAGGRHGCTRLLHALLTH